MSFSARLYLRMRGTTEADPAVLESLVMAHKEETSKRETDADDISSGARAGGQGRRSRGRGRGWTNHSGRGGGLALYITQCRSRRLTCLCSTPCRIIRPHVITVINACPDELAVNLVNCSSLFILYKNELNAQYQYQ
jgi:hypothetical protein